MKERARSAMLLLSILVAEGLYLLYAHVGAASPHATGLSLPWGLPYGSWRPWTPAGGTALLVGIMAGLLAVWVFQASAAGRRATVRLVFGAALLHGATLVLTPGLLSTAVLDDMGYGQILAGHGANPYDTTAASLPQDPILRAMPRSESPPLAGPAWISISSLLVLAGAGGFPSTLLAFRLASLTAHLINGALILSLARRWRGPDGMDTPLQATIFYVLNPVLLIQFAAEGRHESIALTWLLLALWLLERADRLMSAGCAGMALLIDHVMLPATGFVVAQRGWTSGWREAARAVLVMGGLAVLAFAPYARGLSPAQFLPPFWIVPEPVGLLAAVQTVLTMAAGPASRFAARSVLILWIAAALGMAVWWWRAARTTRRPEDIARNGAVFYLLLLTTGVASFQIPAVAWVVGLAALAGGSRVRSAGVCLCAGAAAAQALGTYRLLAESGASSMPGGRLLVSVVAAAGPILFLLLPPRSSRLDRPVRLDAPARDTLE
ncbi:MAG: hypothetical protein ACREAA_06760 [Candidatus Polarisedimenticolia bacterium]